MPRSAGCYLDVMSEQPSKCTTCRVKVIFAFVAGFIAGAAGSHYGPCPPPSKPVPAAVADHDLPIATP